MSVAANLPHGFSLSGGIDRNYLLVGLMVVVAIALVRYSRFVLVVAVFILAVGANLPEDMAQILNVDAKILMASLVAIVLLSLANRIIKLPTGLDPPMGIVAEHGSIALFAAISRGRIGSVRSLIDCGASIDARSEEGLTPLMTAAMKGYDEIVQLLVARGADLNAKDTGGKAALQLARDAGYEKTVSILISEG